MRIAYGHQILSDDDEFIQAANDSGYAQNNGGPPGGTMVDLFPIRLYRSTQIVEDLADYLPL